MDIKRTDEFTKEAALIALASGLNRVQVPDDLVSHPWTAEG